MSTETRPVEVAGIRVEYDPNLTIDGVPRWGAQTGPMEVTLRRWDERVFLHEILHIFLGRHIPTGAHGFSEWVENPAHEKAVREIEDGLWGMGWRLFDGVSHIDPTQPRVPESPRESE
jgi:hypothetical protein